MFFGAVCFLLDRPELLRVYPFIAKHIGFFLRASEDPDDGFSGFTLLSLDIQAPTEKVLNP